MVLKIDGMHCVSCSLNIDGELEELDGVNEVETSYAKAVTVVNYDPKRTDLKKVKDVIEKLGYKVSV